MITMKEVMDGTFSLKLNEKGSLDIRMEWREYLVVDEDIQRFSIDGIRGEFSPEQFWSMLYNQGIKDLHVLGDQEKGVIQTRENMMNKKEINQALGGSPEFTKQGEVKIVQNWIINTGEHVSVYRIPGVKGMFTRHWLRKIEKRFNIRFWPHIS